MKTDEEAKLRQELAVKVRERFNLPARPTPENFTVEDFSLLLERHAEIMDIHAHEFT